MENFRTEKIKILVATDIASRGLDIPHIEHVLILICLKLLRILFIGLVEQPEQDQLEKLSVSLHLMTPEFGNQLKEF